MIKPAKHQTVKKDSFEKEAWQHQQLIIGVDEVGRGCLAGPVVACALVLRPGVSHKLLKDSKEMLPEERQKAAQWLVRNATYELGIMHHRHIDAHNIYQATLHAMRRAVLGLLTKLDGTVHSIVVDAMPLTLRNTPFADIPIHHFYYGESLSRSIASASIIAKVARDEMMNNMESAIPGYGFASHKGYSTPPHKKNIREQGSSIVHRLTYANLALSDQDEFERQLNLFEIPMQTPPTETAL